jgi:putative transposase
MPWAYFQPLMQFLAWALNQALARQVEYLKAENALLRARLPKRITVTPQERATLLRYGAPLGRAIKSLITIVTPRTFARWLQGEEQAERKRKAKGPGRALTPVDVEALVLKLARENAWGYTRILGELRKLGVRNVCRTTVLNVLRDNGLDPGPRRGPGTWDELIKRHLATLWACDFFSVRTWTVRGVVELYVLFFLHAGSRKVFTAGVTARPDAAWVEQQARNLALHLEETGLKATHLVRDRDTKFTRQFDSILESEGIEVVKTSVRAPNMNALAERFVQSARRECLDHFVFFGEKHLSHVVREYERYYNEARPHQGLGNKPLGDWPEPAPAEVVRLEDVVCEERLGGLLKSYRRAA